MREIKRLPTFIKERIIQLHYTKNQTEIVNILLEEDNVKVSRQTVNMWVNHLKNWNINQVKKVSTENHHYE